MTGERSIPAPRDRVWDALLDPLVLAAAVPGCKSLVRQEDGSFVGTATVRVGPVSANFTGDIKLLDVTPPRSYRIEASGRGGAAGFAKGTADVVLAEQDGSTLLSFAVKAEIGGKLAQLGTRLIEATARQMTDQFFDRFSAAVMVPPPVVTEPPDVIQPNQTPEFTVFGFPPVFWVGAAIFLFIFVMMFGTYL